MVPGQWAQSPVGTCAAPCHTANRARPTPPIWMPTSYPPCITVAQSHHSTHLPIPPICLCSQCAQPTHAHPNPIYACGPHSFLCLHCTNLCCLQLCLPHPCAHLPPTPSHMCTHWSVFNTLSVVILSVSSAIQDV